MAKHTVFRAMLAVGLCSSSLTAWAQGAATGPVVSGIAFSETGKPLEGVLVRVRQDGSTITTTVVSRADGRYTFPPGRLSPGRYQVSIRATGYDLKDPGTLSVAAGKSATLDLHLQKTADLAAQLTNGEWHMSWPGTPQQKAFTRACVLCHSLDTVVNTHHDAKEFVDVLHRMSTHPQGASILNPFDYPNVILANQKNEGRAKPSEGIMIGSDEGESNAISDKQTLEAAAYLAKVNLGPDPLNSKWSYPLKTFPLPKGEETHVIMTEYELPRPTIQPHDVAVDEDGIVWYQDFGDAFVGRLDPKTGAVKEWPLPNPKPADIYHPGGLSVQLDSDGNPWFALMRQGAVAKFDKKTEKISTWSLEPKWNPMNGAVIMVAPAADGKVWFARLLQGISGAPKVPEMSPSVHLLDTKTGKILNYPVAGGVYGLVALSNGNAMVYSLGGGDIIEIDAKTGRNTIFSLPTPKSGPRRGQVDKQGRAWFAQFNAGQVGMFDPRTRQIKEWKITDLSPSDPYSMDVDGKGEAWAGGVYTDYIFRLNPETGKTVKYLIPTVDVNIRSVTADKKAGPQTVWVGQNHHPIIVKIEPQN